MTRWTRTRAAFSERLMRRLERQAVAGQGDWIKAMRAELDACADEAERLRWVLGCWRASLGFPGALDGAAYVAALGLGALLMTAHQWIADEGVGTLACLSVVSLLLGVLRPGRVWVSGAVIGLVVTTVLMFELVSGVRPAYEHSDQSLGECLRWGVLALPALLAAALGRWLRRRLDADACAH